MIYCSQNRRETLTLTPPHNLEDSLEGRSEAESREGVRGGRGVKSKAVFPDYFVSSNII